MSFFLSTTHKCARLLFRRAVCSLSPLFTVVDASCCGRAADGMQSLVRRRALWLLTKFCCVFIVSLTRQYCGITSCDVRLCRVSVPMENLHSALIASGTHQSFKKVKFGTGASPTSQSPLLPSPSNAPLPPHTVVSTLTSPFSFVIVCVTPRPSNPLRTFSLSFRVSSYAMAPPSWFNSATALVTLKPKYPSFNFFLAAFAFYSHHYVVSSHLHSRTFAKH